MKFIVDAMLGRLATWLRLLGHDVLYARNLADRRLIRLAQEEGRTIITRDTGIVRQKSARKCIFISSDHVINQLAEMKQLLEPVENPLPRRCARCNSELESVDKAENIQDCVPDYIYHTHHRFQRCRTCGKVYWEGSHYRHMKETVQQALR